MNIQAVDIERDKYGHWTHPAWPVTNDEHIPYSWFRERGLKVSCIEFESDADQDLVDAYFESGEPDCNKWEPSRPDGGGWFVFSIHDTEDGPICVWVGPIN